jgi:hypothetical protein
MGKSEVQNGITMSVSKKFMQYTECPKREPISFLRKKYLTWNNVMLVFTNVM